MIKLIKSTFYQEQETKKALCNFISHAKQLSFSTQCEAFEKNFATYQGRKFSIFVNSGSSANLALIQALINLGTLKVGDLVGFSAVTWSTNVMPLIQLGLKPIPIDVELSTLNVSSKQLITTLKKYPLKAIIITNLLGFCDDIDKIQEYCRKKGIILMEDNCESLGTVYKNKKLGNFSLASTFSFYVGHHMSTIEGGMIATDNAKLATMLKLVRAHGWDRNLDFAGRIQIRKEFKVNSTFYSRYTFYDLGFNLRPTEINGFLGNFQLRYLNDIVKKRNQNYFNMAVPIYKQSSKYYLINVDHIDVLSNFAIPIVCKSKKIRDDLVKKCRGKIEIRPIVGGNIASQPFFRKYVKAIMPTSSTAQLIHEQGLYFGNNPELTKSEIKEILRIFTSV